MYHGSKTSNIKNFEYKTGKRSILWNEVETKSNGFFFALTPQEAKKYGPYVGCYKITCNHPLISGTEGVGRISNPQKINDMQYIFSALLIEEDNGDYSFEGLKNIIYISKKDYDNPEKSQWFLEFVGTGGIDWECLDNSEFVKRMSEKGYDGTVVYESSLASKFSWYVIKPSQIHFLKMYSFE